AGKSLEESGAYPKGVLMEGVCEVGPLPMGGSPCCSFERALGTGVFSVKSSYNLLVEELWSDDELGEDVAVIFDQIWESPAPSKVIAFSWQLLYDRIPTHSNLDFRGILVSDAPWECVRCVGSVETSIHLFLHCPSAMMVWYDIFRWLGVVIVIPHSLFSLFEVLRGSARNAKVRHGFLMICVTPKPVI
ncbi:F-box family protein, partial [Trifolium medium]|nr:F-box family protein [Trifolium medium]